MRLLRASRIAPPVRVHTDLTVLTESAAPLFAAADSFFLTENWWRAMLRAGISPGAQPHFLLHEAGALFPMQTLDHGRVLESLTNPYTCLYHPLLVSGLDARSLHHIGADFARYCRTWPTIRLDALPQSWPGQTALLAGMRSGGLFAAPFDHFGNWYEPVGGLSWSSYLECRRGELRETIRRKLRRLERHADVAFEVVTAASAINPAIAIYEDVYTRSWKVPEPYPDFNPEMMREAARCGGLRLGILRVHGQAAAVQIWIVMRGSAAVLKLAHDKAFKAYSPGTVLTALTIRYLLEHDQVTELDFGRGDDAYKQLWATQRRQRLGLVLINPRRPAGAAALTRSIVAKWRRQLVPFHFRQRETDKTQ